MTPRTWLAGSPRRLARPTGKWPITPTIPGPATGMPVLDCAMAVIECRTRAVYDGGDHDIVLGEVVGLVG